MKQIGELTSISQTGQSISTKVNTASTSELYSGIGKLFAKLARRKDDAQELKLKIVAYGEALAGLPKAELEETMLKFGDGRLGDGVFAPTAAQIAQEVRKEIERKARVAAAARREAEQLAERQAAVERRKDLAPGAMQRADELMRQFREGLPRGPLKSARRKPCSEITPAEAEATLANPPAHWSAPVTISHELGTKLGLTPEQIDQFARDICG